jgi:hypothetical protein
MKKEIIIQYYNSFEKAALELEGVDHFPGVRKTILL